MQFVAVHEWGTQASAEAWMNAEGVTFPALQDDGNSTIMRLYDPDASYVPQNFIIGRDMIIRKTYAIADEATLEGYLLDVIYERDPVDIEMVMDVSGSMNSPAPSDPGGDSKLDIMKQASTMIIDFLKDHGQVDDRMGLVWFTDDAEEFTSPSTGAQLMPLQANWALLRGQMLAHGTGNCTAMGAGMQKAFDALSSSTQKRFAILCTDGMQNIEPKVAENIGHLEILDSGGWLCGGHSSVPQNPGVDIRSYNTAVHTIGIGITANYEPLLQEIADQTGAFYRATDDPQNDLDLIYFVNLCNCMAGGSPAVIHHHAGKLVEEQCSAVEEFDVNLSVRKLTVILSWQKCSSNDLSFWLYAPDGTRLDIHDEIKSYGTYRMATVYLPAMHDGKFLPHVGTWRMVVRGEVEGGEADYHAIVIAEDREIKFSVDFTRKAYEVGDILPLVVRLMENRKPLLDVKEIVVETGALRIPLADLLERYKVSAYEVRREMASYTSAKSSPDPLAAKLQIMSRDPNISKMLVPTRKKLSLRKGELSCYTDKQGLTLPIQLRQPGHMSIKITVYAETPEGGPISRTERLSLFVGPGKADAGLTDIGITTKTGREKSGNILLVTPRASSGRLLGPGLAGEFSVMAGKKAVEVTVDDNLDGTYSIAFESSLKTKEAITLSLKGDVLWNSRAKGTTGRS